MFEATMLSKSSHRPQIALRAQVNAQLGIHQVERRIDGLVHVVVLVLAQTSAEDDPRLGVGQLLVLGVERAVLLVVHRVVGFIAGLPLGAVLAADDGLGLGAELKVLVLDDAGVGRLASV